MLKMLPGGLTHNLHLPTLDKFVSVGCLGEISLS